MNTFEQIAQKYLDNDTKYAKINIMNILATCNVGDTIKKDNISWKCVDVMPNSSTLDEYYTYTFKRVDSVKKSGL